MVFTWQADTHIAILRGETRVPNPHEPARNYKNKNVGGVWGLLWAQIVACSNKAPLKQTTSGGFSLILYAV
jgi:hypothetical protein